MTRSSVLRGLGSFVPERVVTNDELAARLDTSDEWIRGRTGICERRVVAADQATSDLAVEAGRRALKSAGLDRVGAVVLATATPDRPCPATAPEVASRLDLTGVTAFDVAAVCSGFVYALAAAAGLIATSVADEVLVIGADAFSTILDPEDRSTAAVFGDGAGAVVLGAGDPDEPGALRAFDLGSDGSGAELIMVPTGGSRRSPDSEATGRYFTMRGREVFRSAVLRMVASSQAALERAGWAVDDIDRVVAHQANARIVHAVADGLRVDRSRCVLNLDRVGNTAAASIPLALADAVATGQVRAGDGVLMTAFGGGLTWGSTVVRWPDVHPA